MECNKELGGFPTLMVIILPEGSNDIYRAVKLYVRFAKSSFYCNILNLEFPLACSVGDTLVSYNVLYDLFQ